MRRFARTFAVFAMISAAPSVGQEAEPGQSTLITNIDIFDGVNEALIENASVLVEGGLIAAVSTDAIPAEGATVIDGGGRILMPGIIGCHEHIMMQLPITTLLNSDERYIAAVSTATAETYLMNGWTSIRDAAGNTFGLKKAID